jgi:hypothetical protein
MLLYVHCNNCKDLGEKTRFAEYSAAHIPGLCKLSTRIISNHLEDKPSLFKATHHLGFGFRKPPKLDIPNRSQINFYDIIKHTYIPLTLDPRWGSRGISDIPPRHVLPKFNLAMRITADVTGGKPVLLQSISGLSAINPLVAFYDIHGGKREVLFFYFVPDTTRDLIIF